MAVIVIRHGDPGEVPPTLCATLTRRGGPASLVDVHDAPAHPYSGHDLLVVCGDLAPVAEEGVAPGPSWRTRYIPTLLRRRFANTVMVELARLLASMGCCCASSMASVSLSKHLLGCGFMVSAAF